MLPTRADLFELVELGAEHVHRFLAVGVLRALLARGDDDAARLVQNPHRGLHFIDVLAARAAGARKGHFEIVRRDIHLARLDDRQDRHGSGGCVHAPRLFGLRDALYAMDAGFVL